ncbi:hypothetical protein A9G48_05330 [Gilliamella sp. wkB18]|uniref:ImcF-related family protein n=1 Tax=Gilliamella sp. wkB18 TaxID=3120260 RepID=UPI0004DCCEA7|nr:ImcF-related family protein [Gilliamella apicola]KFA59590.1 tssM [Gilliamella apicola]OCG63760.1 hypothetical protein A9G48_05330 [Gilliamella apicola]
MRSKWKQFGLIFIILIGAASLAMGIYLFGDELGYKTLGRKFEIWLYGMLFIVGLIIAPSLILRSRIGWVRDRVKRESLNPKETTTSHKKIKTFNEFSEIQKECKYRRGLFWRYKIRKCLVLGTSSDVQSAFPRLQQDKWQLNDKTLMIYGGDVEEQLNTSWSIALRKHFSRWLPFSRKPLDAIIWVVNKDYLVNSRQQQLIIEKAILQFQSRDKLLKWSAPLYLVAAQENTWSQAGRTEQSVGLFFSSLTPESMESVVFSLNKLSEECSKRGVQQIKENVLYTFLLKLSQKLVKGDIENIRRYLNALISLPYSPRIRGLFFIPHQELPTDEEEQFFDNYLTMTPTWESISDDATQLTGKRIGLQWGMVSGCALIGAILMFGAGLITSYVKNASLINESIELATQADNSVKQDYTARLQIQYQLQQRIEQLLYRKQHGVPLFYGFGLNHNDPLLNKLLLSYRTTNSRNIATPFHNLLTDYLTLLTELPPDNPERAKLVDSAYDVLKAYLMMSQSDKSDGKYLSQFASQRWRTPEGVNDGDWQRLMPDLVRFWGQMLKTHSDWTLSEDKLLVKNSRRVLINKIGVQNAVNRLYQEIIQRASQQYSNLSLYELLPGIDSHILFFNDVEVPGIYTRKAWENTIKDEIEDAAKTRRDQIDWVLGEGGKNSLTRAISPEVLKKELTERYFNEFGAAWLYFLNTIQWQQTENISDSIEQLTLLADSRHSPLIALINIVKYESETEFSKDGISDNLMRTAQEIMGKKSSRSMLKENEGSGPLTATFAPLINLLKNDNNSGLSLQSYLSRVTQVRLKLQNVTNSPDPQAMMQVLAKSVFKGTSVDLTETRDYGNLIAANLGDEWAGFGYSLFKQPLEQSWQVVLSPATNSFNEVWQNYIVNQWEKSFAGRYPFKNSENEASLAELARFLRSDTGIIDNFIINELSGVLEKKGGRWIVNTVNAQGLNFSPEFLETLNLFNDISSELITSGDIGLSFDLMPRSGDKIARTELVINKQKLEYFNQAPTWQRFNWPGDGYSPYSQLSWSSDETGLQLYEYFNGDWAWVRLLETASVKPLDSSRYEIVWKAPDDNKLRFILRTQLGGGPLTLLKLRNFNLPQTVFE